MTSKTFQSINPATGELITSFKEISTAHLEEALRKSQSAFEEWRLVGMDMRANLLDHVSEVLEARAQELASLITMEMGKPIDQSIAEIKKCALACRYYAKEGPGFLAKQSHRSDASDSHVRYDPLGTILAIMPWNFPFWQVFRNAAPTLLAGNTIILKHASNTPQCALGIQGVFEEANAKSGLFQNIFASHEQIAKLIADDRIRGVTLTGSNRAGEKVGGLAGRQVKKVVLELGGSDPFIILADANIKSVAEKAVQARCANNGQSCIAAKRFIVHESIAEEFSQIFSELMQKQKVGDPMSLDTQIGPLATKSQRLLIENQIDDAVSKGAKILTGGSRLEGAGYYFAPTVLTNITPTMRAFQEELFAPVACIYTYENNSQAIALANSTSFGLGASVWTSNTDNAKEFIRDLESGSVFVNAIVHSDPRLPFGGVKSSGVGRELSREGIIEFTNQKTVWID